MRKPLPVLFALMMLAAACGGTGDTTTTSGPTTTAAQQTTTTAATTTTASTTTTTQAPETTTTLAPAGGPFVVGEPGASPVEALPGSDGASGSGCAPGSDALPDGIWFGFITARAADGIDFDLACFYAGDIAYEEGAKDGEEVNNDYYIRNDNPTLRTIAVDATVPVYAIDVSTGGIEFVTVEFADWPLASGAYNQCPGEFCLAWLYVNGGAVTEIQEQYVP
jgi:hypothetical protein